MSANMILNARKRRCWYIISTVESNFWGDNFCGNFFSRELIFANRQKTPQKSQKLEPAKNLKWKATWLFTINLNRGDEVPVIIKQCTHWDNFKHKKNYMLLPPYFDLLFFWFNNRRLGSLCSSHVSDAHDNSFGFYFLTWKWCHGDIETLCFFAYFYS